MATLESQTRRGRRDAGATWFIFAGGTPAVLLRRHCQAHPAGLVGSESQQGGDVAGAVELSVIFHVVQFDVAADGGGDNRVTYVVEFARGVSANRAVTDDVSIEMPTIGALDGMSRVVFAHQQGLHFS